MPRLPRYDTPGSRHHVMNRGARRQPIFLCERDRGVFRGLLMSLQQLDGVRLHGWALMPNHFHLLLTAGRRGLGPTMQWLQSTYARHLNQTHDWDGPIWRARFRSRPVLDDDYWRHLLAYVHLNPVRAGLAESPSTSTWTSHDYYRSGTTGPDWMDTSEHRALFGTPSAYLEYLAEVAGSQAVIPENFDADNLWARRASAGPAPAAKSNWPFELCEAWKALEMATNTPRARILASPSSSPARNAACWWLPAATGTPASELLDELHTSGSSASRGKHRTLRATSGQLAAYRERLAALLP